MRIARKIREWGRERGLIDNSTPQAQMMKMVEELGELSVTIQKGDLEGQIDSIGDCFVVLTILSAQLGFPIEECISSAWNEIKDRKGYLNEEGIFVKEEQ